MKWLPLLLLVVACSDSASDDQAQTAPAAPAQTHAAAVAVPALVSTHPRLVSTAVSERNKALAADSPLQNEINRRYLGCSDDRRLHLLNCWLRTRRDDVGQRLVRNIPKFYVSEASDAGAVSSAWELALIYDALHGSAWLDRETAAIAVSKIKQGLRDTLTILAGDSASLWHNRASLAATALVMAVAIGDVDDESKRLLAATLPHYRDLMSAIALTEAWPEGYNYWIQNRAMLFAHATRAYLLGFQPHPEQAQMRTIFCQHAWWPVYATRPDFRAEGLGDEGSRVDLAEETRPFIDAAASLCESSALAGYSDALRARYPDRSYYEDYRWSFPLFNDPALAPVPMTAPSLAFLEGVQTKHVWFGRDGMNQFYFRSSWDRDAVFLSARAGASFSHHGHYDAGHFTVFHHAPLLVNSSRYGNYFGDNRLHYAIRTVAKNSILVLRPGEKVKPNHKFRDNVSDGGQRLTLPTGSALQSVADWRAQQQQGLHLEGGRVLQYGAEDDHYFYLDSDLTGAYNNNRFDDNGGAGKVSSVRRVLAYLQPDNQLLVLDTVQTVSADAVVKSLFHTINRPEFDEARVLAGTADDGILETRASRVGIRNGDGRAVLQRLLPKTGVLRVVGGPQYRFYVETDGDERVLDGINYSQGASEEKWFEPASWRIELQDSEPSTQRLHLASVAVSATHYRAELARLLVHEADYLVVNTGQCDWVHALTGTAQVDWDASARRCVLVTGPAQATMRVKTAAGMVTRDRNGMGWWQASRP